MPMSQRRNHTAIIVVLTLGTLAVVSCSQPIRSDPNVTSVPAFIAPASEPTPLPVNLTPEDTSADGGNSPGCINDLKFLDDLTIPDGTYVEPDAIIEKEWEVENIGTCNWTSTYSLRHIGGQLLGASQEQGLFPAKKGSHAVVSITFFAPSEIGTYHTAWQAYDPSGTAFGDPIFMDIVVTTSNP